MPSARGQNSGADSTSTINVVPLTLHTGAEIRGVDLTKALPFDQLRDVRAAFLKWKVVFFRDQHLDHAQHVALARQFGEPTIGHAVLGPSRRLSRNLFGRQEPARQRKPQGASAQPDGLAPFIKSDGLPA